MPGTAGQFGGKRPGAAPDIKHPHARAWQLPHEQPVVVGIVVPVQQPHVPILPLPAPAGAETARARRLSGNDPSDRSCRGGRLFRGCPVASGGSVNLVNGCCGPARGDRPGRPEGMVGGDWVAVGYLVAAWYWAATLAGVRAGRRGCRGPALRACSVNGASRFRNFRAFFLLRSISYSEPPIANRTVSSAGPPSRSSSSATAIFVAIPGLLTATGYLRRTDRVPRQPHPPRPRRARRWRSARTTGPRGADRRGGGPVGWPPGQGRAQPGGLHARRGRRPTR